MFREDFVWGVASSSYQVEGRDLEDGAGKMIWDAFTEEGGIADHQNARVACDHMHRYPEDYKLMRLLGVKAYRFSVSWARIMPEGTGRVNEKGIQLYRDMIGRRKKRCPLQHILGRQEFMGMEICCNGHRFFLRPIISR